MSDRTREQYAEERAEAIATLRAVCERVGDDEWPDNLHLSDIIEKHLVRHMESDVTELLVALEAVLDDAYSTCEGRASTAMVSASALIARIKGK